ncbi:unnamed protein product [Aureobasidium pullulans]|nr:unnamed protein product [Aureobasidium pullulans]
MASGMKCCPPLRSLHMLILFPAHIAKPAQESESEAEAQLPLPQTLVRIPMQHVDQSEPAQSENGDDSTVK